MGSRLLSTCIGVLFLMVLVLVVPVAQADEIYGTGPGCELFLCFGFDVSTSQAVGVRVTPTSDYTLQEIGFWFMNNDFSGQSFGEVEVTVEGDLNVDGCSTPDGVAIDSTSFTITAIGWEPELNTVASPNQPFLEAGTSYWIVARSEAQAGLNPVWVAADGFTGFSAFSEFGDLDAWQCGGDAAVSGIHVDGDRVGGDYDLSITNLVAGGEATLTVTGAEPNTTTYVAFSTVGVGATFLGPLNVTLELDTPFQRVAPIATDATGTGEWTMTVPPAASGRTLWAQSAQSNKRSFLVEQVVQ